MSIEHRDGRWDSARERIVQGAVYLTEGVNAAERRGKHAAAAGAALAADVRRYLDDPLGVGLDVLADAYQRYGALHSGNFVTPHDWGEWEDDPSGAVRLCSICGESEFSTAEMNARARKHDKEARG